MESIDILKTLIDAGADVNATMYNQSTLLMQMSTIGDDVVVKLLVEAGANLDLANKFGRTALMMAVEKGLFFYKFEIFA